MPVDRCMEVINDLYEKYSEHFEMWGEQSPLLMNHILAKQLLEEREYNEYLMRRLNERS